MAEYLVMRTLYQCVIVNAESEADAVDIASALDDTEWDTTNESDLTAELKDE